MLLKSQETNYKDYEIKKQIYSLKYGYKISLINTDNQYTGIVVNTNEEALGLIKEDRYQKFKAKLASIESFSNYLKETKITPTKSINETLSNMKSSTIKDSITLFDLLKRTEITIDKLISSKLIQENYNEDVMEQVEIAIKYEGYINKINKEAEKMLKQEAKQIPSDINYQDVPNLASEARQKLEKVNPTTIGQALRISGVNPSDISILLIYLRKKYNE